MNQQASFSLFSMQYQSLPNYKTDESFPEIQKKANALTGKIGHFLNENEHGEYGCLFDWFDTEIERDFGIDIFSQDFDREKGYSIYQNGNGSAFVYMLERLNSASLISATAQIPS